MIIFHTSDSSDEENVKTSQVDQSPGAVKRLFHGGNGTMGHDYGAQPVKNSLIPSRTFNKMKTQRK